MMVGWSGDSVETLFFDVENTTDWASIVSGQKTQLRSLEMLLSPREELPCIVMGRCGHSHQLLVIESVYQSMFNDMTEDDIRAEGHSDLPSFKRFWCSKVGSIHFSPLERVFVHHLKVFEISDICSPTSPEHEAVLNILERLYPSEMR